MAITTTPYGQFLLDLADAKHDLVGDAQKICLLTDAYTPDFANHTTFADISDNQVADGSGIGYTSGGETLTNKAITYNATSKTATLTCDPVAWTNLTGTTRYGVVYRTGGDQLLLGLIDFGSNRTYNAESFQLSFTDGVITLSA